MFVAIIGCSHGEIDKIYETIHRTEERDGIKVSLVLCCGDFQSVRNMTDLRCMACPIKYQAMHDFHRYYSGEKKAPILTIFIGGNHEASNFLQELPYGGWVAPNIYFLGNSNVLRFGHLRIAGISGIFKGHDYLKGRHEVPPYSQDTMRSVYHYRNLDVFRLKQIKSPIDIMISHDWPQNIHLYGDTYQLLQRKPFFRNDIERNDLGSRPLAELLQHLKPSYWFSAHLHVKFSAIIPHNSEELNKGNVVSNNESGPEASNNIKVTKFMALDKVLPRRQYLQIIKIPRNEGEEKDEESDVFQLAFDPEWLSILKSTNHLLSTKQNICYMPGPGGGAPNKHNFTPSEEDIKEICSLFETSLKIPQNFSPTAPSFKNGERPGTAYPLISENPDEISLVDSSDEEKGEKDADMTYQSFSSSPPLNSSFITPSPHHSSQSSLLSSAILGSVRKKLQLPPPATVSNNEEKNERDLETLSSIFGQKDPKDELAHGEMGMLEGNPLFIIDKVGDEGSKEEPSVKKRRNEEIYKSLDE